MIEQQNARIIRVEPTDDTVSLTWMIGPRCNYDCMYCPDDLHDKTSKHPDVETLKAIWQRFYEKTQHFGLPYKISFTGGEVTANKSFLPLVEYITQGNFGVSQIIVSTNGSASVNYYRRLAKMVTAMSFSLHSEFVNEQEFFDKVKQIDQLMIRPVRSLHVNIMNEYWNEDRIKHYESWLQQNQISYSVNNIDWSLQSKPVPVMQGVYNLEKI